MAERTMHASPFEHAAQLLDNEAAHLRGSADAVDELSRDPHTGDSLRARAERLAHEAVELRAAWPEDTHKFVRMGSPNLGGVYYVHSSKCPCGRGAANERMVDPDDARWSLRQLIKALEAEQRRIDELVPAGDEDVEGQRVTVQAMSDALAKLREARAMHAFFVPKG